MTPCTVLLAPGNRRRGEVRDLRYAYPKRVLAAQTLKNRTADELSG